MGNIVIVVVDWIGEVNSSGVNEWPRLRGKELHTTFNQDNISSDKDMMKELLFLLLLHIFHAMLTTERE